MASLRSEDYKLLFELGAELYDPEIPASRRREIATTLMAISEYVIGQQAGWPSIHSRYRYLTTYVSPSDRKPAQILPFKHPFKHPEQET